MYKSHEDNLDIMLKDTKVNKMKRKTQYYWTVRLNMIKMSILTT